MFANEEWRLIEEFPHYSVSNLGRVKHTDRNLARRLTINERGVPVIQLYSANSASRFLRQINQLVAAAFLPLPEYPDESAIWHIDGNLVNCQAANLRWEMRARVIEWNKMHRTMKPRFSTPAVRNNETGEVYENAFACGIAEGILESTVLWHIESQAASYEDPNSKYQYVFEHAESH